VATQIDTNDARTAKSLEVLAGSGQWIKCHGKDGSKAYGIPSQRVPNLYYLTTCQTCSCPDQRRHPELSCKHRTAVRLLVAHIRFSRKTAA